MHVTFTGSGDRFRRGAGAATLPIALALAALALPGCDTAEQLSGAFKKQQQTQAEIRKRYGWDAQVGWRIHNGVLANVTVSLDANQVRDQTVGVLEAAAIDIVKTAFEDTPQVIAVQIITRPGTAE